MIRTNQFFPLMLLSLAATLLSACGGGGAGGATNTGFTNTNNTSTNTNTNTSTNAKPQTSSQASIVGNSTESKASSAPSAQSNTLDTTPPSAPDSLIQVGISTTHVDISWTSATDNIATTTYNIYRDGILIGSVASDILKFIDNTAQANKLYIYSVEAGDAAGNKSLTRKSISVTTPQEVRKGDVTLYWDIPTQREDGTAITKAELGGFLVRYKLKADSDYTLIDIKDNSAKSRVITNLVGDYEFQIAAYDANNLYSAFVSLSPH
jgi:hypothetical protein